MNGDYQPPKPLPPLDWSEAEAAIERMRRAEEARPSLEARARRERIATAVMAGLAAFPPRQGSMAENHHPMEATWAARLAKAWADALIAELDK